MSVNMSVMKPELATFTVRDLNRQPAKVLSRCDEEGEVEIHSRSGKKYSLKAVENSIIEGIQLPDFESHYQRLQKTGSTRVSDPQELDRLNRIIAGEE
jgi:hypothetical protein